MRTPFLLALVLAASPVAAQFRIPKPKLPNPLNRATASAGGPRAPEYDDRVIEITDARITGLLRGLKVEQDQRPALVAGYKKNADDRAAAEVAMRNHSDPVSRWQACMMRVMEIDTVAQARFQRRLNAARERNDDATVERLQDSMTQAMLADAPRMAQAQAQAMQPGGKCGPTPTAAAMAAAQPRIVPEPSLPLADSLHVLAAGSAGMTADQFAVMQERVLGYLTTDDAELARGQGMWAFGATELNVLHNRRAALQQYQSILTDH